MSLKIIHTSDWHLGKKLLKVERIHEQGLFLNWLLEYIVENTIDVLLVSGDIFDSPTPSNSALKTYFDFLKELNARSSCKIIIISGNHDSGKFLNAPGSILKDLNISICGSLVSPEDSSFEQAHKTVIEKDNLKVNIVSLPYFRIHELYNLYKDYITEGNTSPLERPDEFLNMSLSCFFGKLVKERAPGEFNILMLHHLMEGYELSGTEQIISLSGVEGISKQLVTKYFDYAALGHIHKKMNLSKKENNIFYSGSPLHYRFGEHGPKKMIRLDLSKNENTVCCSLQDVDVPVFRELIALKINQNNFAEIISSFIASYDNSRPFPFLEIRLLLDAPNTEIIGTIKEMLKNFDQRYISILTLFTSEIKDDLDSKLMNFSEKSIQELFLDFYREKYPQAGDMDKNILNSFNELVQTVHADSFLSSEELS